MVFGERNEAVFNSGWEVLLGQNEVQNWLRSKPEQSIPMRYPGEWKFAGGVLDAGETPLQAALRELEEEFMVEIPRATTPKLRLLGIRQTRPIGNVSNIMFNFVAAVEENPWLEQLDAAAVNTALALRRGRHAAAVAAGTYWGLSTREKELLAPEVRRIQWLDMRTAILNQFTSMNETFVPVNEFQRSEYQRLNLALRRDPMFLAMVTLLEIDSFPSLHSLQRYSSSLDAPSELKRIQWLFESMPPEAVATAWNAPRPAGLKGMFQTAEEKASLWSKRLREDAASAQMPASKM